jgi:hypothetical protein
MIKISACHDEYGRLRDDGAIIYKFIDICECERLSAADLSSDEIDSHNKFGNIIGEPPPQKMVAKVTKWIAEIKIEDSPWQLNMNLIRITDDDGDRYVNAHIRIMHDEVVIFVTSQKRLVDNKI